jgi:tRNA (guanine37-N1)-methyltransferase
MTFDLLTLFPDMFNGPFSDSMLKLALEKGLIEIDIHNIRDYAVDRHRTTDDYPYGGGAGMVMKVEPLASCLEAVRQRSPDAKIVLTSPRGRLLTQAVAQELAGEEALTIICGRYEGVDERVSELYVDEEISIGDFVLTGGEPAAIVIVDAVARLIPGVLGSCESAADDSFSNGLLEYPQYTRPPEFRGMEVPPVLLSGNHGEIARWRRRESLKRTLLVRPDLLKALDLSREDSEYLESLGSSRDNGD